MKKIKAVIPVCVIFLLACLSVSCPIGEGPFEMPWLVPPERTVSKDNLGELDSNHPHHLINSRVRAALEIVGGQDPRVALRYRLDVGGLGEQGPLFFDYVVLSTARMVKEGDLDTGFWFTLDIGDVQHILENRHVYITPLQRQGVRVLLQVVNCRERSGGFTFANLPYAQRFHFALMTNSILARYNLDGLEFIDRDGDNPELNLFAYPKDTGEATHYDGLFDLFPDQNPRRLGDRINITDPALRIPADLRRDIEVNPIDWNHLWEGLEVEDLLQYFWMRGGYGLGVLMSYFRALVPWQDPNQVLHAVIGGPTGGIHTPPIIVRETGFAGGRTDMANIMNPDLFSYFDRRASYMSAWINDHRRPWMLFTAITDQVNYFLSDNLAPNFGWKHDDPSQCTDLCRSPEGCTGTGRSIMDFVSNHEYGPGILDLGLINDDQLEAFSIRFASGNRFIPVFDDAGALTGESILNTGVLSTGFPFTLLYYRNLTGSGHEVAERLSITSRAVHGSRIMDWRGLELERLGMDGPAVIYFPAD